MCFEDYKGDRNIWLTVENGRYVPAPPIVYVPGLRQIQDRLNHRAYSTRLPFTYGNYTNDCVRLPSNATVTSSCLRPRLRPPSSSHIRPPAKSWMPPSRKTLSLGSNSTTVLGQNTQTPALLPKCEKSERPKWPDAALEKPLAEPTGTTGKAQRDEWQSAALLASSESFDAIESNETARCMGNSILPHRSSSSSLRSILKKPQSLRSNDDESYPDAGPGGIHYAKAGMAHHQPRRLRTKKSVSFAEDKRPRASPSSILAAPLATAAEEGAAIAKVLVGKNRKVPGLETGSRRLTAGVRNPERGHRCGEARWSRDIISKDAHPKSCRTYTQPGNAERGGSGEAMASCLLRTNLPRPVAESDNDSYADDEIPKQLP